MSKSVANIQWLPAEIRCKIYDWLSFESMKRLRLVDLVIKNEIDKRLEFVCVFNVKLNDKTIQWVENIAFPRIDTLHVYELTKFLNSTYIPPIQVIIFGGGISTSGLIHLLTLCNEKTVQNLKFDHLFIPDTDSMVGFGLWVLPDAKTIEIKLGVNEDYLISNSDGSTSDEGFQSRKLFHFLEKYLTFPSLKKIDNQVDLDLADLSPLRSSRHPPRLFAQQVFSRIFNYLNGVKNIKSLRLSIKASRPHENNYEVKIDGISLNCHPDLEELQLNLDLRYFYVADGSTHQLVCKGLKKLNIEYCSIHLLTALRKLISDNSSTLESIIVPSDDTPIGFLHLGKCTKLEEFTVSISRSPGLPIATKFYVLGTLPSLSLDFPTTKEQMEELKRVTPLEFLAMKKIEWILTNIPTIKKIAILPDVNSTCANFMARYCNKKLPGISWSVIPL